MVYIEVTSLEKRLKQDLPCPSKLRVHLMIMQEKQEIKVLVLKDRNQKTSPKNHHWMGRGRKFYSMDFKMKLPKIKAALVISKFKLLFTKSEIKKNPVVLHRAP